MASGGSLVELMISLTLGQLLIGSALHGLSTARASLVSAETAARLQETALYALAALETDLRMSGYLGLHDQPALVTNLAGPLVDPLGGTVALAGCSDAWATNLARPVSGWDHAAGAWPLRAPCEPHGEWRSGSDGLVVKRASADRIGQSAAALRAWHRHALVVSRREAALVYVGDDAGTVPGGYATSDPVGAPPRADTRRLLVHAWYVSRDSSVADGYPSLRRKRLVAGPAVQDEEIMPGVEDLQLRWGVDADGDGAADRYVDPGPLPDDAHVVAVQLWVRVRALERDAHWLEPARLRYANLDETLPEAERRFRRTVVSRTVWLRNGGRT